MSETTQITPFNSFRNDLSKYEKTMVKLLKETSNVTMEKFMVTVENMVRKNDKLLDADRGSLFASILTAAEFGLEPNTPAGLSWIIPRKNNKLNKVFAEWQIGYQGICNLLYRHPRIKKIISELVFTGDVFERAMGDDMNWHFKFEPGPDGERGSRRAVFAVIHLDVGEPLFTYLSAGEINEIKAKSQSPQNYEVSNDPQGWMWKKAAVKQCSKLAPKGSTQAQSAINIDSQIEGGATVILDESGKVILSKPKYKDLSKDKLNIVFGDDGVTEAEVING
jgi:phage RecT family recombinase